MTVVVVEKEQAIRDEKEWRRRYDHVTYFPSPTSYSDPRPFVYSGSYQLQRAAKRLLELLACSLDYLA